MKKLFISLVFLLFSKDALAQWTTDSTVNSVVNAAAGQQNIGNSDYDQHNLVSDSAGGVIVAWQDTRSNGAIYAQRIYSNGTLAWNSNGVPIKQLTGGGSLDDPCIATDGKGGAIIAWHEYHSGSGDSLFAQRIDANGNIKWTADGVTICNDSVTNDNPQICSDDSGGAIIAWSAHLSYNESIYAQRVDSNGAIKWPKNGIAVRTGALYSPPSPQLCSDGVGGAYIAWHDIVTLSQDYVQRISSAGTLLWASPGVALTTSSPYTTEFPRVCSDGNHGVIVEWAQTDFTYTYIIHVQRLDSSGTALWTSGGVQVSSHKGNSANIVSDGSNGVIIAWSDFREATNAANIYTQRVNSSGNLVWDIAGIAVTTAYKVSGSYSSPSYRCSITTDGNGGAIIGWIDTRSGSSNQYLYGEAVSSSGSLQWPIDGITVSKSGNFGCYNQQIVSAEAGKAILVWEDARNSGATNLYAQKIGSSGLLPVELTSFTGTVSNFTTVLAWKTATEMDNASFDIERTASLAPFLTGGGLGVGSWAKVGSVAGSGTSNLPKSYTFSDNVGTAGKYSYRLKQIDRNGAFTYSQEIQVQLGSAPRTFELSQNYPNPFNPTTMIEFTLPNDGRAVLRVYNSIGQEVATLFNDDAKGGEYYQAIFDASKLASGTYFARLQFGKTMQMKKLLLVK